MPQGILNSFLVAPSGPTFFPTDIAGLIRWYEADFYTGSYADGAAITTPWDDLSASAEDATPQVGQEPLFKNTVLASGKSSVLFLDGFKHFDTTEMTLGDYSVVVLWRPNADAIVASSPSGNYQVRDTTGGALTNNPQTFHNDGITLNASGAQSNQVFHVRTWNRNNPSGVPLFYYNKTQQVEATGETSTSNMLISTVGLFNGGPGFFDLVSFLVYNTVLTQTDVDNLHDFYFKLKYPGDFP